MTKKVSNLIRTAAVQASARETPGEVSDKLLRDWALTDFVAPERSSLAARIALKPRRRMNRDNTHRLTVILGVYYFALSEIKMEIPAKELMQTKAAPHPSMMAGLGRTDCYMSSKHVNRIDKSCVRC